jgi:type III secretion protein L
MNGSNVIKRSPQEQPPLASRGIIKRPVIEAHAQAQRILAQAEERAEAIRLSAEESALELREAAYREGLEASLLELNQHLLDARERRDTALADVEQDVLRLAVKLAEKIIGHEVEQDPKTLADIVATALRNARQHELLTVRINPADLPIVQAHRERLDPLARARFLDLVPDPRVSHGGCIVESESGTIDAQLSTQLAVLERALLARAAGKRG